MPPTEHDLRGRIPPGTWSEGRTPPGDGTRPSTDAGFPERAPTPTSSRGDVYEAVRFTFSRTTYWTSSSSRQIP